MSAKHDALGCDPAASSRRLAGHFGKRRDQIAMGQDWNATVLGKSEFLDFMEQTSTPEEWSDGLYHVYITRASAVGHSGDVELDIFDCECALTIISWPE